MSGDELECRLVFDTTEALEEHIQRQNQMMELRNKGADDAGLQYFESEEIQNSYLRVDRFMRIPLLFE